MKKMMNFLGVLLLLGFSSITYSAGSVGTTRPTLTQGTNTTSIPPTCPNSRLSWYNKYGGGNRYGGTFLSSENVVGQTVSFDHGKIWVYCDGGSHWVGSYQTTYECQSNKTYQLKRLQVLYMPECHSAGG